MNKLKLRSSMEQFFKEDIGERDVTTESIFPDHTKGKVVFQAKENGTFCGEEVIKTGFRLLDSQISIDLFVKDGDPVEQKQQLAVITGNVHALLQGERVILNLIQRMSGIATSTRKAVDTLNSSYTRICDTRKTAPGLRMLDKYAVHSGGGFNHRFGLYDGVMIKDNHIAFAGSIRHAVETARASVGHMVTIEVETETNEQVTEAANAGADVIMFDNRSADEIKDLVKLVPDSIVTEASGGITLNNLGSYQDSGVDYISLGFLTHSFNVLDVSANVTVDEIEER